MSRRRPVWRPSDIRNWDRPTKPTPESTALAAPPPPAAFDMDMEVKVCVGRENWSTKLRWVTDLLDDAETTALKIALTERRPFEVSARQGRAAMMIARMA